jgi:hypothetical protein
MAHCECCDLDLDEIERYCPGCGAPRPRTKVVDVSTSLRESFHAASGDADTEYAFGGKRMVRTAPPRASATPHAKEAAPPREQEAPPPSDPEPPPEPAAPEVSDQAEVFGEPEVSGASDAVVEPDPVHASEPEPPPVEVAAGSSDGHVVAEPVIEPEPPIAEAEPEPEPEPVVADASPDLPEDVDPEREAAARDGRPDTGRNPPTTVDLPQPARDEPAIRVAAVTGSEFKPYVVLPARREAVAVKPAPARVVTDETEPTEARRRRPWTVVLAAVVVLAVVGGGAIALSGRGSAPGRMPFTAQATDGSISLDGPAGWRIESRGTGVVGIGEPGHDLHVHATAIRRSALKDGLSLKRRAQDVQQEFLASLEGAEASAAAETKIGPYAAIRQTLSTRSAVYVHTVVKMPKYFVNVLAWAPRERFDGSETDLTRVVGTLQSSG